MKQHITEQQWNKIFPKNAGYLLDKMKLRFNKDTSFTDYPNVGKMIEFLGDTLDSIENMHGSYLIYDNSPEDRVQYEEKELCDALWELCKIKLNK